MMSGLLKPWALPKAAKRCYTEAIATWLTDWDNVLFYIQIMHWIAPKQEFV